MADKREFLVVIAGKESVSPAAGRAEDALGDLGDQAKKTEKDFDGLDRKMREHADTITHLRQEIAKTGDVKLFSELGRQERAFGKLEGLRKSLVDAAGDAAPDMAVSLSGRLGPLLARMPISGPMGIALTAAAGAAAPAAGAVIASGLIGGAAGGGIVGGLMVAKNDAAVKSAAAGVAESIGDQLKDAAAPFVPAAVNALNIVRDEARAADGDLRKLFQSTARYLEPLSRGAGAGARGLLSGLADAAEGAEPVIDALADGVAALGETVGDVFEQLSDDGPEAAQGLRDGFWLLTESIDAAGDSIEALTTTYGFFRKMSAAQAGDWATVTRMVEDDIKAKDRAKRTAEMLTVAEDDLTDKVKESDEAFRNHIKSIGDAAAAYEDARRASWDFKDSLAGLKDQVKEYGTSLDENTPKGRDNLRYLDSAIQKANSAASATEAMAIANGQSAEGAKVAGAMLRRTWINDLIAAATKAGIAKKDIERLVAAAKKADGTQIDLYFNQRIRTFGRPIDPTPQYVPGLSEGGEVGGGGPPGKDTQIRALASDEYVLTGAQVRAAGGPRAIDSALKGGGAAGVVAAAGGRGGGGPLVLQIAPGRFTGLERMFLSWLKEAIGNAGGNTFALGY